MGEKLRFDGRVALVTGAGRGIGLAHAKDLAARGASVIVNDIGFTEAGGGQKTASTAMQAAADIVAAGGKAIGNADDAASSAGAQHMIAQAYDTYGRLDILINNAGIYLPPKPFEQIGQDEFDAMMLNHLQSTINVTRAAWPRMIAAKYGRVVMTTSGAALFGIAGAVPYCTAKGAIFGLTRSLALEGEQHGVLVNGFWPSAVTRMSRQGDDFAERNKRPLPPEQCSQPAVWLAHESCTLNGEILHGGAARASRVLIAETVGIFSPSLSIDDIAANQAQMMREDGYLVFKSAIESTDMQAKLVAGKANI